LSGRPLHLLPTHKYYESFVVLSVLLLDRVDNYFTVTESETMPEK
jgi:hypothetical protein